MNGLFEFDEDFNIVIKPQILILKAFKAIMDKYKNKHTGIVELNYIAFLLHPKSDFNDIRDEAERSETILESMHGGKDIKIDSITEEAIVFYKSRMHTTKTNFLDAALDTLDKTTRYLEKVDYDSVDSKGNPAYKPKEVMDIITQSPKLMSSIKELEEQVRKDAEVESSLRGSGKKGVYEDG